MAVRNNTTLDDYSAIIGFSATLKLVAFYGGKNLYVPGNVTEDQEVSKLLGVSAAVALSREFGFEWVFVPDMASFEQDRQRGMIWGMLRRGVPVQDIARWVRMSERRIMQIRTELEAENLLGKTHSKNPQQKPPAKTPR
jgi:hypothetical protein